MGIKWNWGWEIDAVKEKYQDAGWSYTITDTASGSTNFSDSSQPLIGYGGGAKCLRLGSSGSNLITTPTGTISANNGWIICDWKAGDGVTGTNPTSTSIFSLMSGTSELIGCSVDSNKFQLRISGSQNAETTLTWQADRWYRIGTKFDINGPIWGAELYINSVQALSGTTSSAGPRTANSIRWTSTASGSSGDISHYFDHTFLYDSIADSGNTALFIQGLRPDGDVATGSWVRSDTGTSTNIFQVLTGSITSPTPTNWAALSGAVSSSLQVNMQNTTDINAGYSPSGIVSVHQIAFHRGDGDYTSATGSIFVSGTGWEYGNPATIDTDGTYVTVFSTASWTSSIISTSTASMKAK